MPLQPNQYLDAYQRTVQVTRDQVVGYGLNLWRSMPDYRDANVDLFVKQVIPRVRAGQMRTAALTAGYFRASAKARGDNVPMVFVDREQIASARKVDPVVEYRRPAVSLYTALSQGLVLADAVARGGNRLEALVTTDLQLAKTTQAQASMQGSGYTYYRRVLTGLENCGLCAVASTQRYHVRDLMPIHPGCDCAIETVSASSDPGQIIDPQLLESTHADIAAHLGISDRSARNLGLGKTDAKGRPISDYTELVVTRSNSEWGPTLAWRSDKYTGSTQLAA